MIDITYICDVINNEFRHIVDLDYHDAEQILNSVKENCLEKNISLELSKDDDDNEDIFFETCSAIEKYCHLQ